MSKKLMKALSEKKHLEYFKSLSESVAYKELDVIDKAYYDGEELLSDLEYDVLRDYLNKFESIKEKVGKTNEEKNLFTKVVLEIPMGSLDKVNNYADLKKWYEKDTTGCLVVSHKIDGSSIELTYEDGVLSRAVTRGDGFKGDDITANARFMQFPKTIPAKGKVKVRGEVVLFLSNFEKYIKPLGKKNARNSVAGIMGRLDQSQAQYLNIIAFDIIFESYEFKTKMEKFNQLKEYNFDIPNPKIIKEFSDFTNLIEHTISQRKGLNYLIDGLVGEENDIQSALEKGVTKNRPKASKAYKFESESAETILNDVVWQVGKSGRVTPVGIVEPIDIQGVTISNVTLNNMQYILDNNIDLGSTVLLARANDVIPKIIGTIKSTGNKINPPKKCPSCNSVLNASDLKHITCENHEECPLQSVYRITHYLKTLDVKGMGDSMIEKMLDEEIINEIPDLYNIDMEKVKNTEGLSLVNVQKTYKDLLLKSKDVSMARFIKALTIKGVGETVAELVMTKYSTFEEMYNSDVEVLQTIHGIGESASLCFVNGIKIKKDLIEQLRNHVSFIKEKEGSLSGMTFCFTGFRDKDLKKALEEKGAKVADSYSKTISYLVCLDKEEESTKLLKAKKDKVALMNKDELSEFIKNH